MRLHSFKLLALVGGFCFCGLVNAQAPIGGLYNINPVVSQGGVVFPTGAVLTGSPATRFIADDFDLSGFEGHQLRAIGVQAHSQVPTATAIRTISLFTEGPFPNPISGVGNPGNLIVSNSYSATFSYGSSSGYWFPQNVTLPGGKVWVGLTFSGPDPNLLNMLGLRAVTRIAGNSSNVAFISDAPGAPGNNPAGQQIELGQTYGGEDLSFALVVAGQQLQTAIRYGRIGFSRRVMLTAVTNGRVLARVEVTLPSSVQTRNGTITVPAVTPYNPDAPVSLYVDGGPYLRSRVDTQLPNPPVQPEAVIQVGESVLRNGDCDESGEVDNADIDFVIARFGRTWVHGTPDANADLDVSFEVDAADIDIVIANFGEVDDP